MFGFKTAKKGRFIEIGTKDEPTGKEAAEKIIEFIKGAEFTEPYPEFTVHKSDLQAARITEYHLVDYLNWINKDNEEIRYANQSPKRKDGFPDYDIIEFVWQRVLFQHSYGPTEVVIKDEEKS
ncbi:MAG: hypothetical protein KAI73_05765 [Rhodospirillaceae bacterium]|nr:hypothetical protein [Rhodospirillaceae bacterium]